MCFSVTGESRQCLLCSYSYIIAVLHCGSGRRYPAFLRLSHTNRQLSAANEQHLFSRQRLFLDPGSGLFCCLFFILSNFSWFVKCFLDFSLFFSVWADFWRKVGETIHFFCTNCKNQNRMLDFIETRCYTKTQIYFFVSVSRRSLPCISVVFFKSQNIRFCSSDCFPESLASGHVAWLQTNRYQRIDKANKRHSFLSGIAFSQCLRCVCCRRLFLQTAAGKQRFRKRAANESHKKKSKRWKL